MKYNLTQLQFVTFNLATTTPKYCKGVVNIGTIPQTLSTPYLSPLCSFIHQSLFSVL